MKKREKETRREMLVPSEPVGLEGSSPQITSSLDECVCELILQEVKGPGSLMIRIESEAITTPSEM